MRKYVIFAKCVALIACTACSELKRQPDMQNTKPTADIELSENIYNRIAQQLAGQYIPDQFKKNNEYTECIDEINRSWNILWMSRLSKIKPWADKHVTPRITECETVFYPFGGPDIAHATQMFPSAKKFVLVGLEPVGSFKHIEQNIHSLETIKSLKAALSSYLSDGFFITSEMMTQLYNVHLKGATYLLLFQLAQLGYRVDSVNNVYIDKLGHENTSPQHGLNCIKIVCSKNGNTTTVYYSKLDVTNPQKFQHITNFIHNDSFVTFVKSASYAMHNAEFSGIRSFIVKHATAILQDDTGVPFKFLDDSWKKYAFGLYTTPTLKIFSMFHQDDLATFFKNSSTTHLPFAIGYGPKVKRPNLLLAVRPFQSIVKDLKSNKAKACNCAFAGNN